MVAADSPLRISSEGSDILVKEPGSGKSLRFPFRGWRLSESMDLLAAINTLATAKGVPLHSLARYEHFSLWSCWQHYLSYPYLQAYSQAPGLFDWLSERAEPASIALDGPLPGEVGKALLHLRSGGPESDSIGKSTFLGAAARAAVPGLWARSARRRESRIAVYTPDMVSDKTFRCDFRFAKIHGWLRDEGRSFSEIFHMYGAAVAWRNARTRGRIPLHLELWDRKEGGVPPAGVDTGPLAPGLRFILEAILPGFLACCRTSARRIDGLRRTLRASGIRLLLSMDDYRSSQELLMACRLEGVRSVWIQHGLLTRFHPGLVAAGIPEPAMAAPDAFLARAPFWKGVLDAYAPRLARVARVVSGLDAPGDGSSGAPPRALPEPGRPLVVLFLLETLWDPAEAARFLGKMLDDPRLRVHFKIRPDMDREKQVRPYFGSREPHEVALDLGPELARAHVVVGSHSSLLYKLLEWRKPVFRLLTSFEYGEQLSRFGLVDDLAPGDDFHARFTEALARDPEVYEKRFAAYQGTGAQEDYRTALAKELDLTRG